MVKGNRYQALIGKIFSDNYKAGATAFEFGRGDLTVSAAALGIELPKNLGDVIYSVRFRSALPPGILATQPPGMEWIIEGAGRSAYRFRLVRINRIVPRADLVRTAIPDATPELIRAYALDDEQALLAIVRYNRLIDTFLGLCCTNPVRDSSGESSVVAGLHEQTHTPDLQNQELAGL
ncbi:MAG: hypothetical protein IOC72_08750 [Rhodobacter sp.]|nr:hypothetical protein [Rhodobacter sp.]MCA3511784.1 hypothetical protein [Rhodobacter sp.]MCA3520624.1 hypothetical protein [Rhodobacter sp.]MCA3524141.1 hypothetical protein [Rhodobacter sp.]MCA3530299.1 hypothetical protein [Rhodobacter sp.]